jgi:DNA-binding NtrC family response regulator
MFFLNCFSENQFSNSNRNDTKEFKILLIDDETDLLKVLKMDIQECYKGKNIIVDTADSGKTGLEYIENDGYRLILLDLKMPTMNGHQVLQEIRKKAKKYNVVIMTAYEEYPLLNEVQKKSDGFLEKPFEFDELKKYIDKFIEE